MGTAEGKYCPVCRRVRERGDFHRNRARPDGLQGYCKECYKALYQQAQRLSTRGHRQRLKDAAYAAYGGYVCVCCGEREPKFLSLDHVDGGGGEQRRSIGVGPDWYRWLRNNHYPTDLLQVLCHNCNLGRYLNKGVCPHQQEAA